MLLIIGAWLVSGLIERNHEWAEALSLLVSGGRDRTVDLGVMKQ